MSNPGAQPEMTVTNDEAGNVVISLPAAMSAITLPPDNAIALAKILLKRAGADFERPLG